jgi:tRNA A-37 threonylcarbamoyl transferase component Bud32/dienelactone hydrolase
MALSPGVCLGPFEILSHIGAGGMGEVYRARDTKLGREVAIKVLPEEFYRDKERLARFEREAKLLASLNHANIATLYGLEESEGQPFLAMELIEGETLAERIARGPLSSDEALPLFKQIAEGLEAAHERGVIHRDLKPANIKITPEGHPKILDFGLAKGGFVADVPSESPTLTRQRTGTGVILGTAAYMSPQQARGKTLDQRTDIWSFGCCLYEALSGKVTFQGETASDMIVAILEREPDWSALPKAVPERLRRLLRRCLDKDLDGRLQHMREARLEMEEILAAPVSGWRLLVRSRAGLALVVLMLAAVAASTWVFVRSARARWASDKALPEIQRLLDDQEFVAAFRLAQQAEPYLAGNPEFQHLWRASTLPVSIRTTPAGAQVYLTEYGATDDEWDFLGVAPLDEIRIPTGYVRVRVEKAGFQTIEAACTGYQQRIEFALHPTTERPGMIRVPPRGGALQTPPVPPPQELEPYWLDRYEVTNRAFKEFVERGGYREKKLWTHPILAQGRVMGQGVTAFVDRTGRPGPSTWELGSFPEGTADFPVGGVSWYEAAAYCEYAGKQLPTLHHWYRAAGLSGFSSILAFSNLNGQEAAPVGTYRGIGPFGHYDMAGNVREWVLNPVGDRRYILGGAWSDPAYTFTYPYAVSPEDRSAQNGFRCAVYPGESAEILGAEVVTEVQAVDHTRKPVDDVVFRLYRNLYAYEATPLNANVDSVDEDSPYWRGETVTFDAPYGEESIIAHLYLPKTGNPPYQAVVYYPGMYAFVSESSRDIDTNWFDFIVRTGRAVIHPVYDGTYERRPSRVQNVLQLPPQKMRELVIHWTMDIGRSIDYLETRSDIDATKLAYYGYSWGAWNGPVFLAIETRFKAGVFLSGGVWLERDPETEPTNFAPRVTTPVLMVNGRDDFWFPLERSQLPLFRLLGAPDRDKRHVAVEGGHTVDDWQAVVREVLDWLDRYLGPVR